MLIDKKEIVKELYRCAKQYNENLANKRIIIVFENEDKSIGKEEIFFPKSAFYHLTGITAKDKNVKEYNATKFYNDLINGAISSKRLHTKDNTSNMKLDVLYQLMYLDKNAQMIGNYSSTKIYLRTQKVLGGINSCMGFIKNNNYKYYIPNTILKEDIRNVTTNRKKIVAIFKREMYEKYYKNITYLKKNYVINDILKNKDINELIDIENLYSENLSIATKIQNFLNRS